MTTGVARCGVDDDVKEMVPKDLCRKCDLSFGRDRTRTATPIRETSCSMAGRDGLRRRRSMMWSDSQTADHSRDIRTASSRRRLGIPRNARSEDPSPFYRRPGLSSGIIHASPVWPAEKALTYGPRYFSPAEWRRFEMSIETKLRERQRRHNQRSSAG